MNTIESEAFKLSTTINSGNYVTELSGVSGFSVNIPNSVNTFEVSAFQYAHVTSITFDSSSSLTEISNNTFSECNKLNEIAIPDGVTQIATSAFNNCDNLTSVTLPNSLESIGTNLFPNLTGALTLSLIHI